ncbi:MAG TPA: metalloregulator ArsR/SmtB family transcription factor [Candidatus Cryosericum sp.]|nr:metalloregulator ArsR/SmtB family transcription factor [Candidatus Cryosericum sp.]
MSDTVEPIAIARALGDPTRARIVSLLAERDLCVCELTETLGQSQANISGHLKLLVASGLVASYQRSYWTHYALQQNLPPDIAGFVHAVVRETQSVFSLDLLRLSQPPSDVCARKQEERRTACENTHALPGKSHSQGTGGHHGRA